VRIAFRQEHGFIRRALSDETWQAPFPQTVECGMCHEDTALPILVINDEEGFISQERVFVPGLEEGIWPHDCLAIALYLCPKCGEITALWNQG